MNGKMNITIPLVVVGCDYRTAATVFREKLVTTPEKRALLFHALGRIDPAAGLAVLETCNRVEWIVSTENPQWMGELLKARMISLWKNAFRELDSHPVPAVHVGDRAIEHVFRVVVGMESLATGEAQIAGQFQSALKQARKEATTSPILNRLASAAGRLAKAGYRVGFRSNHRQGIHGLVGRYLGRHFPEESGPRQVLVVGMGNIGRKTAHLLEEREQFRVIRVNRTVRPEHQGTWRNLDELAELSCGADALVIATGGLSPVLTAERLELDDRERPLLIMDIGIPRQVAASVQQHPSVLYRNIDDLLDLPPEDDNPEARLLLDEEIDREMERFTRFCMERDMVHLLDRIHQGRQEYTYQRIPTFVESQFSGMDEKTRNEVASAMKKFIGEYASDIHTALQTALEDYWSQK